MQTFVKFFKIILEISFIMLLYYAIGTFLPIIYKVSTLCWIAVVILVLLFNYNFLVKIFIKEEINIIMIYFLITKLALNL